MGNGASGGRGDESKGREEGSQIYQNDDNAASNREYAVRASHEDQNFQRIDSSLLIVNEKGKDNLD